MALKLSAPVGDKNRITKPDPRKPNQKFKPVQNKPADVELVRLMLKANGYTVEVNGKCDAALIKMIRDFQRKKLGFKKPDGIVDPGMQTWSAGLTRLSAMVSADAKVEVYEVQENGKTKYVSKSEYEAGVKALKREILSKAKMMMSEAESWEDFCNEVERTRQAQDGLMNALVEFAVSTVNDKTDPPWSAILDASSQASLLKSYTDRSAPDWKKVYAQDQKATKAYNKGVKAFKGFIKARIDTAGSMIGKLEVVRDTSFAVVEAYMTARLVATKGMSPAKAHGVAAASTEALKSGAGQFGEYLAGNNVTLDGAAKKVFIDSFIAGLAGAAGGKLTDKLAAGLADDLLKAAMPKLSKQISKKAAKAFFEKFLKSKAGQAMVTEALKEVIGLAKPMIEKGRPPNSKEIKSAVAKVMTAGIVSHAAFKSLESFSTNCASGLSKYLKDSLVPGVMKGTVKSDLTSKYGADLAEKFITMHGAEIYGDIAGQLAGKSVGKYADGVVNGADGTQSAAALQKLANEQMRKDLELRKKIHKMIMAKAKRKMKKLEAA
ncbi:Putative peptidoglycan binding domain-containing protein [Cribrihabitans marinus]|uniref:Putative peptidoglycan binding domain-containing protein n=1 Tax=Cribrihabitans marinus TaxID=1227549 RepID=A0A1H7ASM6_9RHOB|nr:peptidoglycan-binding domain-containing protein [Cribrihabitans marinus]SEJ64035.1 Putative peptidoglycan binding domain-containing protein [Cribrihabitans marinus]